MKATGSGDVSGGRYNTGYKKGTYWRKETGCAF